MRWRIIMAVLWAATAIWVAISSPGNWFAILLPSTFALGEAIVVAFETKTGDKLDKLWGSMGIAAVWLAIGIWTLIAQPITIGWVIVLGGSIIMLWLNAKEAWKHFLRGQSNDDHSRS